MEPMELQHKAVPAFGVKVVDDEKGIVEALVSVTGNVDDGGDVIMPGAYSKTLKARNPKGVHGHSWLTPVAKTVEAVEFMPGDERLLAMLDEDRRRKFAANGWGALYVKGQYNLNTQRGREAYEDVKFYGPEQEWSIGYSTGPGDTKKRKDGTREITSLELYEWSDVLFGMNSETVTGAVKAMQAKAFVVVEGSYEDTRRKLQEALPTWATQVIGGRCYAYVEATFSDSVIVEVGHFDADEMWVSGFWKVDYTLTDGGVEFGDPVDVAIQGVVEPKSAEEAEARQLVLAQRTFALDPAALLAATSGGTSAKHGEEPHTEPAPVEVNVVDENTNPDEVQRTVQEAEGIELAPNKPAEIPVEDPPKGLDELVAEWEMFEVEADLPA